jgi:hypothetical protein
MKQARNQQDAGRKLFFNPDDGGDTATTRHDVPEDKFLNMIRYYKRIEGTCIIFVVTEKTGTFSINIEEFFSIITKKKMKRESYHCIQKQMN